MNLTTVITTDANEREKAYEIRCKVFVEEPLERHPFVTVFEKTTGIEQRLKNREN